MMSMLAFILLSVAGVFAVLAIVLLLLPRRPKYYMSVVHGTVNFITLCFIMGSSTLSAALVRSDFSVKYVAEYTDRALPFFYKLTAFWAGQEGSMLLWGLIVALCCSIFILTERYEILSESTRRRYHIFSLTVLAFFALIICAYSNPFLPSAHLHPDGNGLNPLLQNPGMIFHPPLLFMGYGLFIVPACLALAQALSGSRHTGEVAWSVVTRPFILTAWSFLTAGIALGAWWAYMELGWGGYWAWDPVENASLVPWLIATAYLHTGVIEQRRGQLSAVNTALISLTFISTFFATYIVRSGVIQSVHAFGDGGVGTPLLLFTVIGFFVCIGVAAVSGRADKKRTPCDDRLAGINSKEGILILTAGLLLLVATIIPVATLYPVITSWFGVSRGLNAGFYVTVCIPLFTAVILLAAACPSFKWGGGFANTPQTRMFAALFIVVAAVMYAADFRVLCSVSAVAAGVVVLAICMKKCLTVKSKRTVLICGIHGAIAVIAIAVAFSAPFKTERDFSLKTGESADLNGYTLTAKDITFGDGEDYVYARAVIEVTRQGKPVGILTPEQRIYHKWNRMPSAEASTIFSLGSELYASLLSVNQERLVQIRVSSHPMVNWLWIGSVVLSLLPLLLCCAKPDEKKRIC